MTHTIKCKKLGIEAEGFDEPPYPGEIGQKIMREISKQAWALWQDHQTMLINEYRLNLADREARAFLAKEMDKFLFGEGSEKPSGYREMNSD